MNPRRPWFSSLFLLALLTSSFVAGRALAQNLVANPGFETGDFTSWSLSGDSTGVDNTQPRTGSFDAFFAQVGTMDTLSQTLLTTPGQTYDLSFWLANEPGPGGPTQEFQVWWDGNLIFDLTDTTGFAYTEFTFPNLTATTSSTTLMFAGQNDPGAYFLDDVSVVVPEPSTWTTMAIGSGLLIGFLKARRRTL
jgi:hypothetical protein